MKAKLSISIFILFLCSCSDKKIVKKNIGNSDIEINWYFYSYISNTSPDFIEVKNKQTDSIVLIAKAEQAIKDVEIKNDTILIRHTKFNDLNTEIKVDDIVFNYNIVFKEITSHELYVKWLKENEKEP